MKRPVSYVTWVQNTTWHITTPNVFLAWLAEGLLSFYAIGRGRVFCRLCRSPLWKDDVPLDVVRSMNTFWSERDAN